MSSLSAESRFSVLATLPSSFCFLNRSRMAAGVSFLYKFINILRLLINRVTNYSPSDTLLFLLCIFVCIFLDFIHLSRKLSGLKSLDCSSIFRRRSQSRQKFRLWRDQQNQGVSTEIPRRKGEGTNILLLILYLQVIFVRFQLSRAKMVRFCKTAMLLPFMSPTIS